MATFTITTTANIDTLTAKAGGDLYNVNGWTLIIDQDSRVWLNQSTATSLWTITLSASLWGNVNIDWTWIWMIPYTWWSWNVPAWNTVITNWTWSWKLIWVHSALTAASTATWAAMPVTWFLRVKQKTWSYQAWALTWLTATASDSGRVWWIELVWDDASTIAANRLWVFNITGSWYEVWTTNGTSNQTMQIPNNGLLRYAAWVFIEKSVWSWDYEFYPNAWTTTTTWTESVRGKVVWIDNTWLVRIGNSWAATNGYTPVTWLKVVIGNIFFECCTTAARTANVIPNATIATRYDFTTTGWWVLNIDKCNMAWYLSCTQAYSVQVSNSWFIDWILLSEVATPMNFTKVWVWNKPTTALLVSSLTITYCFAWWTFTDCVWTRVSMAASGAHTNTFTDIDWFTFIRDTIRANTIRANATTYGLNATRMKNCTFTDCVMIQWPYTLTTCDNISFTGTVYCNAVSWTTVTTYATYVWLATSNTINCTFSWLTMPITNTQPYTALLAMSTWCANNKLRNIGTRVAPLTMWSTNACWLIYSLSTWCFNTKVQRVYVSNTRTWIMTWDNSSKWVIEENVFWDYADAVDVMAVLNMERKWMWWTWSLTAQTSVYWTHWRDWFISTTVWRIAILMNEATSETSSQVLLVNGSNFTSAWWLYMPVIWHSVTFTMPNYILWHTWFSNTALVMAWWTSTNYNYNYSIDKNDWNWFSTMTTSNYTATTLWTALNAITWIDASKWFKLKLKITTTVTNTTAITSVYLVTTTTTTSQDYQYPLDVVTLELTWLQTWSEVRAYLWTDPNTVTELWWTESSWSTFSFTHDKWWQVWYIQIFALWYNPITLNLTYSSSNISIPIQQIQDRWYSNP